MFIAALRMRIPNVKMHSKMKDEAAVTGSFGLATELLVSTKT